MWGARHQMADADTDCELFRAEWLLTFLAADMNEDAPKDLDAVYEFNIGDSSACLRIRGGRVSVRPGKSPTPSDVTVRASAPTVAALVGQKLGSPRPSTTACWTSAATLGGRGTAECHRQAPHRPSGGVTGAVVDTVRVATIHFPEGVRSFGRRAHRV